MLDVSEIIELAKYKTIENYKSTENIIIIKLIKEYCENHNVILEYEEDINFMFTIYSSRPFKDSNNLCNLLFTKGNIKYIILHTKIENTELMISINNIRMIYFKLLFIPNTIVYNKFNLIKKQKNSLIILPDIIKLLLQFNNTDQTSILLSDEQIDTTLLSTFLLQYKNKLHKETNITNNKSIKAEIISNLYHFVKTMNIVLLDYYGLNENPEDFNRTLQIIYQENIITEIQNKLTEILKISNIKGDIIIQEDNTYIINDFRLKKTLIYVSIYNKKYKTFNKINVLNCFNELTYNIIPVEENNNLIPHPYILLKYTIINLIYVILYLDTSHIIFLDYICNINILIKKINDTDIKKYKFIGIYQNEELQLEVKHVYRPYQYKLKNGELRII